jgi:starvation-inducible DNA-binding protein
MSNDAVISQLKTVLADTYALYLKTQNYHWNVTGPNFKTLHLLFEEQYNDLAPAVDEIAERIRTLGEKAPGTWNAYAALTGIKDGNENAASDVMLKELAEDQALVVSSLKDLLNEAEKAGDEVTVDLAVGRMAVHEKAAWMLRSSV